VTPALVMPWAALAVGLALYVAAVVRIRSRLTGRPWLWALLALGLLPAAYVGLLWTGALHDTYLRLARPWAAVLGTPAILFIVSRVSSLTTGARRGRPRLALSDILVVLAAFAASIAGAGPELGRPLDRLTVLVVIDRSRSIDLVPNAESRIASELSIAEVGMREDDLIGTIVFGSEAATEDPPRPKSDLPAPQQVELGRDGTDISAAIRRALAEVPPDSAARIVLLSDGVATRGDTMGAAAAAVAAQIPVDVVPLEQKEVPDIRVVALRGPTRADAGEAIELRLVTSSPADAEIEIRIKRDGKLVARADAKISAGEDLLRIRQKADIAGMHRYDVEISAKDPTLDMAAEDNIGSTFVRVRGESSALVLEGDPGKGEFIASALEQGGFRVERGGVASVPGDLGGLAAYDVVVLSDIRAMDVAPSQIDLMATYVRDLGGGMILMGGDRSMGPGGYSKTSIEEISPVSFDLKQDKRRASLAEVIGIDISGSMAAEVAGHTKLELANEAAARSAALLGPGDMLGVAHVDTAVRWSVPLGPVDDPKRIEKAIRSVGPGGGGILVDITLNEAYAALAREKVNLKHVLLFADGADAENVSMVKAQVSSAMSRGITTSVVALGNGKDVPDLEECSRLGKGRFYLIEDATRLPAVFAQETILAARSAMIEEDFRVALGAPSPVTKGIAFDEAPPLHGYVVTIPKGRARVLLTGPEGDPVLATWSAGLGRSAAFTSDLKDRWGEQWTTWPNAARMVVQVARHVARKGDDRRVRLESDTSGGQLHVRATVVGDDGRAHSFRRLMVRVSGPDGFSRDVALEATGAGAYSATVPLSRPGTYIAVARDEMTGDAVGTTGSVLSAGEELRPTGSDVALLTRIADLTGGNRRDTMAGIFADRASRRFAYEDITSWTLALSAFGLLLAVAGRRLAVPELLTTAWTRAMARLRRKRRKPAPRDAVAAEQTVSSLLDAKARSRDRAPPAPVAPPPSPVVPGRGSTTVAAHTGPSRSHGRSGPSSGPRSHRPSGTNRPSTTERHLSAAEILLARRRGKGR